MSFPLLPPFSYPTILGHFPGEIYDCQAISVTEKKKKVLLFPFQHVRDILNFTDFILEYILSYVENLVLIISKL